MTYGIDLNVDDKGWSRHRGLKSKLRHAAERALELGGAPAHAELAILLTGDTRLAELNTLFRGKAGPTNVLSFPARGGTWLGDIAIAFGVTAREAADQAKRFGDHATHLAVHGVLHLLGFDHVDPAGARRMERLEIRILSELGIANPYLAGEL